MDKQVEFYYAVWSIFAIIGLSYMLYQAVVNHDKFIIAVLCVLVAMAYVDSNHKARKETLMYGFLTGLFKE